MPSITQLGTKRYRRRVSLALAVLLAVLVSSCGGGASQTDDTSSLTTVDAETDVSSAPTTAAPPDEEPTTTTSESEQPTGSECSLEDPASCGGSATLVFGGEIIEFDFFACYFDDDAAAAVGSDSATFAALGQVSRAGGTASVGANSIEYGITTHEVFYGPDSNTAWHGEEATDLLQIEGNRVFFEGNFVEVVDGAVTGQSEVGSLDATCGP